MTRLLDNAGMAKRSNISVAILLAVLAYGIWEIWHAMTVGGDPTAYVFGVLFIAGSIYGLRTTLAETRDVVIAFDADPATGRAAVALWRPFGRRTIDTSLDRITGWRHWIQTGSRGQRAYFLLAREPSHDGTLRFTLERGMTIPEPLRRIAPEAIEDFERETGVRRDG